MGMQSNINNLDSSIWDLGLYTVHIDSDSNPLLEENQPTNKENTMSFDKGNDRILPADIKENCDRLKEMFGDFLAIASLSRKPGVDMVDHLKAVELCFASTAAAAKVCANNEAAVKFYEIASKQVHQGMVSYRFKASEEGREFVRGTLLSGDN